MPRPSKPIISKALTVRAALTIIDRVGIEELSIRSVASELGVKAPSLYYHFQSKADLLSDVAKSILEHTYPSKRTPARDWKEAVLNLQVAARRAILRHPRAAPLMLQFFPRHLMLKHYDRWISTFDVPEDLQMVVIDGLEKLTFGSALFSAMSRSQGIDSMPKFDKAMYPNLALATKASKRGDEALFIETVKRFLASF